MSLRIDVASDDRDEEFIEYPSVLIYPEAQRFKMVLSPSNRGTLYDWMSTVHGGMPFYTKVIINFYFRDCSLLTQYFLI